MTKMSWDGNKKIIQDNKVTELLRMAVRGPMDKF